MNPRALARRLVAHLTLLLPVAGAIGYSSCIYVADDCDDDFDDDDDFCDDDDDNGSIALAAPRSGLQARGVTAAGAWESEEALRLRDFRIVPGVNPRAHPIRRLSDIQGISVLEEPGTSEHGEEQLRAFTQRVFEANRDLIGLPARAGMLVFDQVHFLTSEIWVVFDQRTSPFFGPVRMVPGAHLVFVYDRLGNLIELDNTTLVQPD